MAMCIFIIVFLFGCCPGWLSLTAASRGFSLVVVPRLLTAAVSLAVQHRFWGVGSRSCSSWAQGLRHTGLVAPWDVASPWIRDRTLVSCVGKRTLYYWAISTASDGYFWVLLFATLFWRSRANNSARWMSLNKGHLLHELHIVRIPSPSCDISNYEETVRVTGYTSELSQGIFESYLT